MASSMMRRMVRAQRPQHEQQLASLRDRQSELQKQKTALQAELDRLIDTLSF